MDLIIRITTPEERTTDDVEQQLRSRSCLNVNFGLSCNVTYHMVGASCYYVGSQQGLNQVPTAIAAAIAIPETGEV